MSESYEQKKKLLMEKRKKLDQLNQNSIQRAKQRLVQKEQQSQQTNDGERSQELQKKSSLKDFYKMGVFYQKKSKSVADFRVQEIQTDPLDINELKSVQEKFQDSEKKEKKSIKVNARRSSSLIFVNPLVEQNSEKINTLKNLIAEKDQQHVNDIKETKNQNKQDVLKSLKFNDFFTNASKYVEKLLLQESQENQQNSKGVVVNETIFELPSTHKNQIVSHLEWSNLMPEIFLSVYMEKDETANKMVDGWDSFLLWNREFTQRPEFELKAQSKVERAIFSQFASENVIAGCESGSICLYDLRVQKEPVQFTSPSSDSHRSPIVGLRFIGGRNSNNLITASEEGRLCVWSINSLNKPIRKIDLNVPISKDRAQNEKDHDFFLEPFSLSSVQGDTSGVYIGTNDKNVYKYKVLSGDNHNDTSDFLREFSGHKHIVNCIHHNKTNQMSSQLGELMLTGSFDWTVKLWSLRKNMCVYTFNNHSNPITCVNWNPLHPIMFSSSDSSGKVCVMNLLQSFEQPVYECQYEDIVFNAKWDNSGENLAVTDSNGRIIIKSFDSTFFDYDQDNIKFYEQNIKHENN